jgi:hypothetical protein
MPVCAALVGFPDEDKLPAQAFTRAAAGTATVSR